MGLSPLALHSSQQFAPLLVSLFTLVPATAAVVLRVLAHRVKKSALWADDYIIFVALFFAWVNFICVIIATSYGGIGVHLHSLDHDVRRLTILLKTRIAIFILWQSTLSLVRISFLALYIRIFDVKRRISSSGNLLASWFHYTALGGILVAAAFFIVAVLDEMLLCRPLAVNWDLNITKFTCGNGNKAYIATGVINLLLDVLVICLPIPRIWNLQMPRRSKIVLSALFGCGFVICIITIIRIASKSTFFWTAEDPTYTIWKIIMWSQLEPNLAIVCACVPLLRPIFGTFFASHLSWHRSGSTGKSNSKQDDSIRMQTWTDVEAESRKGNKPSSYGAGVPVAQEQDYSPHYTVMGAPGLGKRTESEQALGGGRGFQMKMYDTGGFAGQEKATRQYYGSR